MKTLCTALLVGIVLLLSFTASAQKVVEGTLSNVYDKPQFLGFFIPDGAAPIPGVLVNQGDGYYFMFHEAQAAGLTKGTSGYFCLQPNFYHSTITSVTQDGSLKYVAIDGRKLGAHKRIVANFADDGTGMSKMFAAVPESSLMADNGNLEIDYQLLPVKRQGDSYRIHDFLYTETVPNGVYPLFGRNAGDGAIYVLGYLEVVGRDWGKLISILPE